MTAAHDGDAAAPGGGRLRRRYRSELNGSELAEQSQDGVEERGESTRGGGAVEQVGDRTQQVAQQVAGRLHRGDHRVYLVQVYHQAKQVKVQGPEDEVQPLTRRR